MIKVDPTVPATPRLKTPLALEARMASATPGALRSSSGAVASGVKSLGPNPVPPVVKIRSGPDSRS